MASLSREEVARQIRETIADNEVKKHTLRLLSIEMIKLVREKEEDLEEYRLKKKQLTEQLAEKDDMIYELAIAEVNSHYFNEIKYKDETKLKN